MSSCASKGILLVITVRAPNPVECPYVLENPFNILTHLKNPLNALICLKIPLNAHTCLKLFFNALTYLKKQINIHVNMCLKWIFQSYCAKNVPKAAKMDSTIL